VVPGAADGSLEGVARKPLTVDFHEPGVVAKLAQENQFGPWFQLSDDEKQQLGSPWGPGNPQALNRYAYVQNNPLRYTDPSGHCPICPALPWLVTGLKAFVDAATVIIGGYLVYDSAKHLAHPSASPLNYPDTGGNTAPSPLAPTPTSGGGVQVTSKTLYNKGGVRIDIENPNPNQRPGQVHIHVASEKYIYDPATGLFKDAPNSVQRLLENKAIQEAIREGCQKYLGISQWKP
jgi:hypothetical protein